MLNSFFMAKKGCWRLPVTTENTSESSRNTAEFGIHLTPSKSRASIGTNADTFYLQKYLMYFHVGESIIFAHWSKISPDWDLLSLWHLQWWLQPSAEHTHLSGRCNQRCRVTWHHQSRAELKRRSKVCNSRCERSRRHVCSVVEQGWQTTEQWGGTENSSKYRFQDQYLARSDHSHFLN